MRNDETLKKYHRLEQVEEKIFNHTKKYFNKYLPDEILKEFQAAIDDLNKKEFIDYFNFYKYGLEENEFNEINNAVFTVNKYRLP